MQKPQTRKPKRMFEKSKPNKGKRRLLAGIVSETRKRDYGRGFLPYNPDRRLVEAPFFSELLASLKRKASAQSQVRVLDKGAGTGSMATEIKDFNPKIIHVSTLTLANTLKPEAKRKIDSVHIGIGLRAIHKEKFDIIVDSFGEDYHIGKRLCRASLRKSIFELKKSGELFTVIPMVFVKGKTVFSVEEGRALIKELSERQDITVKATEIQKRVDRIEYVDLVLHITKR